MKLYTVLESLQTALPDCEITGVTDDTRKVREGMIFVCIKGSSFDGHTQAEAMLAKGAVLVITERDLGLGDRQRIVSDSRKVYGDLCAAWYGHPERKLRLIGVTGTNGKTTVSTLIWQMLRQAGKKAGLIGTVQYAIEDTVLPSVNTTPLTDSFFSLLAQMAEAGCEFAVMEVSSFGLEQHRIGPAWFETAVFLNLTQDHLDVHGTMEQYYQAKKLLFSRCDSAWIDSGDAYGRRLLQEISCPKMTFAVAENADSAADYLVTDRQLRSDKTLFTLQTPEGELVIPMRMTGQFNISNAAAAIAVCRQLGIPMETMLSMLREYPGVRGRCELIPTGRDFTVICDYAHTPDALEKILQSMKQCTRGRLIALFGCGGNRDRTKRPKMAAAAARYADHLIITSDNPRDEDPDAIIAEILTGLADTAVSYDTEPDRQKAIAHAVAMAQAGDVIVLAGKGHEDYQIIAGGVHLHMDERELVQQALAQCR